MKEYQDGNRLARFDEEGNETHKNTDTTTEDSILTGVYIQRLMLLTESLLSDDMVLFSYHYWYC